MKPSVIAGLPVIILGLLVSAVAVTYPVGTIGRMGPGYLPLSCGILLAILGGAIALFDHEEVDRIVDANLLRPAASVIGGLVAWALTVEWAGLIPATFLLVGIVSFALRRPNWLSMALTAAVLSAIGVAAFIYGLHVRLAAFGA
ncbi:tripartite tricarboxylate transporter TctB family protein [Mesorhizobium sp. J428]|uniref:tripartite tricarboxylate transporter TctB family protein n=1 Tax=Mesorhizobium sp. J428 TaxID=2898440 RepID=UPI0021511167|nr:tripartite tricarboxylate transporter TctB family protein [Mesorhizobium sp. J428]MCR5856392.1 tripartite tricarboxylate transporter TctB family protein [Mesorhizobium sp. J428]